MDAITILNAVAGLIASLAPLAQQAAEAQQAGDQATLDAIHAQVVAASNALAPTGAVVITVD